MSANGYEDEERDEVCCGTLTHEARSKGFESSRVFEDRVREVELPATDGERRHESLFEAMKISYDEFSQLDINEKMRYVRESPRIRVNP